MGSHFSVKWETLPKGESQSRECHSHQLGRKRLFFCALCTAGVYACTDFNPNELSWNLMFGYFSIAIRSWYSLSNSITGRP